MAIFTTFQILNAKGFLEAFSWIEQVYCASKSHFSYVLGISKFSPKMIHFSLALL